MLDQLHFLRPLWLLALIIVPAVWWLLRHSSSNHEVGSQIATHLADALTLDQSTTKRLQPIDGIGFLLLIGIIALAGPTFRQLPSPWFSESAPLVVAIEVTDSMRSNDFQPTRLDRARFKILDLVKQRTGARTALIAYAGTSHIVVPPTKDADVFKPFLESLDPAMMPSAGNSLDGVLTQAHELLADKVGEGTVMIVTDGIDPVDVPRLQTYVQDPATPAVVLFVVGTPAGGVALMPDGSIARTTTGGRVDTRIDIDSMRAMARSTGIPMVEMQTGAADITSLLRQIENRAKPADDPDAIWRDEAWWLIFPLMLLVLASFRRGWVVQT